MQQVRTCDLALGDIVQVFDGPFGTGIVKQIADNFVTVFRPYGTTADFTYTGGIICYTGIEEIKYHITDSHPIPRWRSSGPLR